jgi:hypothetical protein
MKPSDTVHPALLLRQPGARRRSQSAGAHHRSGKWG